MHLSGALSGAMQAGFAAEAVTMQTPEHRDRLLALRAAGATAAVSTSDIERIPGRGARVVPDARPG